MSTEEKRQQLRQQLIAKLREMFQMDQADLDFGIYRIMNAKRDEVERFLEHDLLPTLRGTLEAFQPAGLADKQSALEKAIEAAKLAGFDPEQSPKVRQLRDELAETVGLDRLEEDVYSDLHTFFSRYYQNGDFMSLRRYKEGVYALPYEGEEVKLHWANADQYYIKSAENFTRYAFKTAQGRVRFELAAAGTERDNNKATGDNERRFILAADPLELEAGELIIRFEYRPDPDKRKQKELNALAVETLLSTTSVARMQRSGIRDSAAAANPDSASGAIQATDWPQWRAALAEVLPTEKNKTRTTLEKHLSDYTAKNTFDYFIHKDLGRFLRRELDFFIKNEVMHLDDIEEQTAVAVEQYLARIKAMRRIAHKLIAFLAQLENFQKKLWLKKKFVLETNWLITLDRIDPRHYPELCRQAEIPVRGWDGTTRNQREEWVKLFAIDEILPTSADGKGNGQVAAKGAAKGVGTASGTLFDQAPQSATAVETLAPGVEPVPPFAKGGPGGISATSAKPTPPYSIPLTPEFLQANPFLVLDTAFIDAALKDEILAGFENLDEQTNGLLVHGENFQALNLLRERYREQVKCIYIDPPYNTGGNDFIYKDAYQHSSWASFITDRLALGRSMQTRDGTITVSIDDVELHHLAELLGLTYGDNELAKLIWDRNRKNDARYFSVGHEYMLVWANNKDALSANGVKFREPKEGLDDAKKLFAKLMKTDNGNWEAIKDGWKAWFDNIPVSDPRRRLIRFNRVDSRGPYRDDGNINWPGGGGPRYEVLHPITQRACKVPTSGWRYPTAERFWEEYTKGKIQFGADESTVPSIITRLFEDNDEQVMPSVHYSYAQTASQQFDALFGEGNFDNPKPWPDLVRVIRYVTPEPGVVMDYFAGSGSTAHAVLDLQRSGYTGRAYVLVEMGGHFDSVLRPRIQKASYSAGWNAGKPVMRDGLSQTIKYLRLESYEDTCDNLALARSATQQTLIDQAPALREGYYLNYLLDMESRASLLSLEKFDDPFNVALSITRNDETREVKVDLPETFNYLLGLRVKTQRRLKGVYEVTGTTPAGDSALILWRNAREVDNDALDTWFRKQAYNTRDMEFDLIYVNGDNNLENLRRPDETWKVLLIEEAFHTLMFAVEEV